MNPLSRAMKMVRLATRNVADRESNDNPSQPTEALQAEPSSSTNASVGQVPDGGERVYQETSYCPPQPMQLVRSSTPIVPEETGQDDSALNDISISDLVFKDVDTCNTFTNQDINQGILNCYLPSGKGSILNRGNMVANVSLDSLANDLALLDGAANVQGPVKAVDCTLPQEIDTNLDIIDLDKRGCNDQRLERHIQGDSANHHIEENREDEGSSSGSFVDNQDNDESTAVIDGQGTIFSSHVVEQVSGDVAGEEEQVHGSPSHARNTVAENAADDTMPRSKKRKADQNNWKKNVNKNKRAKGEAYLGRKYEEGSSKYTVSEKPAKLLGDRCNCKTVGVTCANVTDETRQIIHKEVWSLSWPQRNVLVKSLVHKVPVGRHRVEQSNSSRSNTLKYHLNVGSGLVPVAKRCSLTPLA
ncbi:hypothetical protein EGW08_019085 [Elysia chlorotica]|uniref:Uncharacterized protein n=1 Tax=Elysia chlorotica TaxID=188477 RepID=A0A3S0ZAA7_ELYCH|nr:hypothetical protein EGW08_019085 [Elysia chlorotica]